jgi:hypothetical protein
MVTVIGIIIIVVIIIAIEVPALWKKKWIKELWVFSILLLAGTTLSIAQALRIHIPNPVHWISVAYKPLSDLIFAWLQ